MRYTLSTLGQDELNILKGPYFGGEWLVYLSHVQAKLLGKIAFSAAATGLWTPDAAAALPEAPTGADIQVVAITPIKSSAQVVATFACEDNTATPVVMNGVATFSVPEWMADQSHNFPRGVATDLVPATLGKKFTEITSLTSVTGGSANMELALYQLPDTGDWTFIGCTKDIKFNDKSRMPKGVDCGMETDAFIKAGKTQAGELSIGSNLRGFLEGLARFSGQLGTAMLVGVKDGEVTSDRLVFTDYRPACDFNLPEGDNEATCEGKGKFKELLMFAAPYEV